MAAKIEKKPASKKEVIKAKVKAEPVKKLTPKQLEAVKKAEKAAKEAAKEAEKLAAKAAKEAEKAAKEEAKEKEKAAAKKAKEKASKGKKGSKKDEDEEEGFDPEDGDAPKKRYEEDEEEDDFADLAPKQVKMTFDEDIDEEIIPVRKKGKAAIDEDIKDSLVEEILSMSEDYSIEDLFLSIRNMELFRVDSDECVVRGCDNPSTTAGYCRYHYIKLWKDVKKKQLILSEGKLAKMIEELVRKYPMKYVENIITDLADDKAFSHVLKDLDIETDEAEIDGFDDDELLDDDQDIAFETKVTKPTFDD